MNATLNYDNNLKIKFKNVNVSKSISILPKNIKIVDDNITDESTLHLQNILHKLCNFIISNKTNLNDEILDKFTYKNVSMVNEFKKLWMKLFDISNNITENSNIFLKKLIQFHYTVLEYVVNEDGTTIDYKRLREEVYKIAQAYLKLTDTDRNSFSSSFPSLSNFFNNKILLDTLKKIKPDSSIKDYIDIKDYLIDAIIKKKLSN
ncbi:Nematode fatty acid retinoid binding family-containing protein [Strongyloides ratti]|uniref:Nematode fatty acid retinoid binding family-containing protein n=1 Tax=Strongyloides ratti TaxID=34506 RepID=A0A090MX78_STRRB|nr:Nematode fatty acid retinoid binding family-containing protein [Strongyloides ratti]CEF64959.1 Nematode fatty acid retinoid binding family-containing protein [Strongyloides ratti]